MSIGQCLIQLWYGNTVEPLQEMASGCVVGMGLWTEISKAIKKEYLIGWGTSSHD